jgi:formylglycine-generating enzyme required for sulfatase activity/tetratricopeptide (TPR) repeat protein
MSDLIGTRLNQYELREIVRRGGMSTVFKAYQESLDRYVAVKVLFTGRDPQFAARFKREARAIAALQHHNILPVYDYGEEEGLLYLVLQYIENGATLADMLGHPMPAPQALRLTSHVLDALDYAHKRGIIHRDIKPANVLMPSANWPMLADFGIAKLMNDNQARLTLANQIIGTAAYMAPEQATGRPIDARTDLYAAGVVLYELVTGRVPFDADTPMAVLTKHVYEPPPPARTLNPDLAFVIEGVLQKSLEKDPNARYQTAADMAEDLRRVANQIERDPKRSQVTGLYQVGLRAFEQGHWDEAVDRLGQLVTIDPEYEDASELLDAARDAQERAKEEARQRIEMVRQQRASATHQQLRPPTEAGTMQPAARTALLKTTKFPEVEAPVAAAQPVPASAPSTRPLTPTTQPLDDQVQPAPSSAVAPATSGRTLPIVWIVAGAVIVALLLSLFFILRNGATPASNPTAGANPTAAGGGVGQEPTIGAATQAPAGGGGGTGNVDAPAAPEPAGRIVIQDDFNNKEAPVSALEDNLRAPDFRRGFHPPGVYHVIPPANTSNWVVAPRRVVADFSYQIEVWDDSDELKGDFSEGVIFRARDLTHFYALLIDPRNGRYTVRKYDGLNNITEPIPAKDSPLVNQQKEHNIVRVDGAGSTFTIYLNGKQADTFTDDSYSAGMVGLIAANVDAIEPHPHFDNMTLWSADAAPVAPDLAATREDPAGNMVLIPGGEFIMGGNERADAQTHVVGTPPFYIDRTEVTNAAYKQCIAAGKCSPPREESSETHPDYFSNPAYDTFPVMKVTYDQARTFCGAVGKRLPTEAEWEKAASWNAQERAKLLYPFGDVFDQTKLNSESDQGGAGDAVQVGTYEPEANGTVDMAGNLSEWTSSLDAPYPYSESDGREEYPAPGKRVFRGGSWAQTFGKAKVYDRRSAAPDFPDREIGFRCAVTP